MTMTDERLAELDAVMARATEGPWQRKSGFEKLTIIGNIDGEIVESQTKYTYEMVCEVYDDNGVIVAGRNVTAIVALHNAYPDLKAHIEAQAATIARLREALQVIVDDYQTSPKHHPNDILIPIASFGLACAALTGAQ